MQACIFDIKRFAIHDGPGIRTTVFFKGCFLDCWWCHNPEGIRTGTENIIKEFAVGGKIIEDTVEVGKMMTIEEMMEEIEKDRIFMDESGGGVTFSGGEPLMQFDFLIAALNECRRRNIHTCLDTSGHAAAGMLLEAVGAASLILYDLKLIDDEKHIRYTGISNKQILNNLKLIHKKKIEAIIRIPLIPGINMDHEQITQMIRFLALVPEYKRVDLLPYHHFARSKYKQFDVPNRMNGTKKPDDNQVKEIEKLFINAGFTTKIGG